MAVDDGVVDSPIALVAIHERSISPSPTWLGMSYRLLLTGPNVLPQSVLSMMV